MVGDTAIAVSDRFLRQTVDVRDAGTGSDASQYQGTTRYEGRMSQIFILRYNQDLSNRKETFKPHDTKRPSSMHAKKPLYSDDKRRQ